MTNVTNEFRGTAATVAVQSSRKLPYATPNLKVFGSVATLTLGSGGTCADGVGPADQKGGGLGGCGG